MPVTDAFLKRISDYRIIINQALAELDLPVEPHYLYDPIRYVATGHGKRLRPILVRLAGEAFGADADDLLSAGLAVEILHNFTLVHDDIMDCDFQRHGQPTVHKKWDEPTAILAGDGLFTMSQLALMKVTINPLLALRRFNEATLAVCEGQAYDKEFETDSAIDLDQYLNMIALKTGNLIGLCAELGAILGNQPETITQILYHYGIALGKAFQIQDDILEITSNSEKMGKSLGSDISAGKQTILTILAREKDPKQWEHFSSKLYTRDEQSLRHEYRKYFMSSGLLDLAQSQAEQYVGKAYDLLTIVPEENSVELKQFTEMILTRNK